MPKPQERRVHPRFPCQIPVLILSDDFAWPGMIIDCSEGGAFITATLQPGVGGTLGFRFERPADSVLVEVEGVVRRIEGADDALPGRQGFGVQFTSLLSEAEKAMK